MKESYHDLLLGPTVCARTLEARRPHLKATDDSWRVDETSIEVKKQWMSLYRAVDSEGKARDFFFSPTRDAHAAKQFFLKTLAASHTTEPRVITIDKNAVSPKAEGRLPEHCELRHIKYLNNLIKQGH